ncbi:hypothetical protein P8605_02625 [Streptomyces sp. T-3]|nr:hypothetical protein [Streptomyces sp. T-3]
MQLQEIGVLPPAASRGARLAGRWLTRRRPTLIEISGGLAVTLSTAVIGVAGFLICARLITRGDVPSSIGLPLMLLAPLLVEFLPSILDAGARRHVCIVDDPEAVRHLLRLVDLQADIEAAAHESKLPECAHATHLGHLLLWEAAELTAHRHLAGPLAQYEEQLQQLSCAAVQACAAAWDLEARVTGDHELAAWTSTEARIEEHPADHAVAVAEATAALKDVAVAQRHAAALLRGIDPT